MTRKRRNELQYNLPNRVVKKDEIVAGIGIKEIALIAGVIIGGFILGTILKTFVNGAIMGFIVGIGIPGGFGLMMFQMLRPQGPWNENVITNMKRSKAYRKQTKVYFYQRRR